jgi:hypothetical protein
MRALHAPCQKGCHVINKALAQTAIDVRLISELGR